MACKVYDSVTLCDYITYYLTDLESGKKFRLEESEEFDQLEFRTGGTGGTAWRVRHTEEAGKFFFGILGPDGKFYTHSGSGNTVNAGIFDETKAKKYSLVNLFDGRYSFTTDNVSGLKSFVPVAETEPVLFSGFRGSENWESNRVWFGLESEFGPL